MNKCPLCGLDKGVVIYSVHNIPVFQNKVYSSVFEAQNAITGSVELKQCGNCGFVFNALFNPDVMDYDDSYQNEQNHSGFFRDYLYEIIHLLMEEEDLKNKRVIEIGCGKGYFFEKKKK